MRELGEVVVRVGVWSDGVEDGLRFDTHLVGVDRGATVGDGAALPSARFGVCGGDVGTGGVALTGE